MKKVVPKHARSERGILDRITVDSKVLVGKPIVRGTRISVEFVIDLLARGWTIPDVLKHYRFLEEADVRACLAYAREVLSGEKAYTLPA
ncbi:MAG: DUF433 domain-containing protein [Planctomycetes bacterium]|nr:DUF433 domain-containing protein [Planctomycetota bacterium]